jgi:hypothetical protein
MTDQLRTFTDQVTRQLGFDGPQAEPEDDEPELDAQDEESAEDEQVDEQALAAAFWESLPEEDRALAEDDENARAEMWGRFLDSQGLEVDDDEADDEADDESDVDSGDIRTAQDFVAGVLDGSIPALGGDGRPMPPVEYLMALATCTPAEWRQAAQAASWPIDQRPSRWQIASMSRGAEAEVARLDWETNVAQARERGRCLGQ